jgi:hypothetical protein
MRSARLLMVSLFLAGCPSTPPGGDGDMATGNQRDLTSAGDDDMSSPPDLRTPPPDLRGADLSTVGNDMTTVSGDMTTVGGDMTGTPSDMTVVVPADMTAPPPDLVGVDLVGADLRMPDMVVPPDMLGPPVAWGQNCVENVTNCRAGNPALETGFCSPVFGQPICLSTCDDVGTPDWGTCEGGQGLCVPTGSGSVCLPKCGDSTNTACAAGSSCAFAGYRAAAATQHRTGFCIPDCNIAGSADECKGAGRTCDRIERRCTAPCNPACGGATPVCDEGTCRPTPTKVTYDSCTVGANNGCESDRCFSDGINPGYCGKFCNNVDEATTCGANNVCWYDNNRELANLTTSGGTIGYPMDQFTKAGSNVGVRTMGACLKTCATSADCPAAFYCGDYNGVRACIPGSLPRTLPAAGSGTPGDVCTASSQCQNGCGVPANWAVGFCLNSAIAVACPVGTLQLGLLTDRQCLKTCTGNTDNECGGGGLTCANIGLAMPVCYPLVCRHNLECAPGAFCDAASGECRTTAGPGVKTIGTACAADTECAGNFCATAGFPGGYCTATCTTLPDLSSTCPSGSFCAGSSSIGEQGICFKLCDAPGGGATKFGGCRTAETYQCFAFPGDTRFGACDTP